MGIIPGGTWNAAAPLEIGDVEDIAADLARLGLDKQNLIGALGSIGAAAELSVAAGNAYDREKSRLPRPARRRRYSRPRPDGDLH